MIVPLAITVLSVLIGATLALAPREGARHVGPVRTFALTAALAVVAVHLLPEAVHAVGLWALPAVVVGAALPGLVGALVAWTRHRKARQIDAGQSPIALEVSYAGLVAHRIGDGFSLGAYGGEHHGGHAHGDVLIAVAAHTVPVTTVFVLAFVTARGRRAALLHALGLIAAGVVGIVIAAFAAADWIHGPGGWVAAIVAGLLVHVVLHDLGADPPKGTSGRALDFAAAAAGVGVALIGSHSEHGLGAWGAGARERLWSALEDLTLETAPMLLLGLAIAAALQAFGTAHPGRWLRDRGALAQALRGAVSGAPLPLCSCNVLPAASNLHARHAAPALVVAFLIATPELGVETLALTGKLLGWPFALLRVAAAIALAILAGLVVSRLAPALPTASPAEAADTSLLPSMGHDEGSAPKRFLRAFDELLFHVGAWTAIGLIGAAFIQAFLPEDALSHLAGSGLDILVISALSIPSYICASSATPLGAVLIEKGLSPGAVLVGLLLGPATTSATLMFLRHAYGLRAALTTMFVVLLSSGMLALGVNLWLPELGTHARQVVERQDHGRLTQAATAVLLLLLTRSVWLSGTRSWLSAIRTAPGQRPDHDLLKHHEHEHGHFPAH